MKYIQLILIKLILLQVGQIIANDSNSKQREIISGSIVDPCNDFHQYACGSWSQVFTEAVTQYNDSIDLVDYNVNKEMSEMFNKFSLEGKPKFVQEAYKYYKSCTDWQEDELNKNLMLTINNEDYKNEWYITLAQMRKYGLDDIFVAQTHYVWADAGNRTALIYIGKPNFIPIDFDTLKNEKTINDNVALNKLWLKIKDFEKELSNITEIKDDDVEYEEDRMIAIKDLELDWLKNYVKVILNQTELEPQMLLYLPSIPYMKALEELLKKYDQNFLNQYLKIRFLSYFLLDEFIELNKIKCLSNTRRLIPFAMNWLYEQQHPELLKEYQNIYQIFENLRNNFKKTIIENKYNFNTSDVKFLVGKVDGMKLRLNNLPRTNTVATLEEFYQDLNLNDKNFYENHLKLLNFIFQKSIDLVHNNERILNDTFYIEEEHNSSPVYIINANVLTVPLTLLQQPIYSPDLDDIYKYSTLGFWMTKEFFAGFVHGSLYNGHDGRLSSTNFIEYPLFNASINFLHDIDSDSVNDKIQYASGVRYAYETFFSLNPDAANQKQLINNEEMSLNKVFFLNLAQMLCDTTGNPFDSEYVKYALKYFPKFSEAFNCTKNHVLYSTEDRHVWS